MGAVDLLHRLRLDGLTMTATPDGRLLASPGASVTPEHRGLIASSRDDLVAALLTEKHVQWVVHFESRDPVVVTCAPAVDHAEALRTYADAVAAVPYVKSTPRSSCGRCAHRRAPEWAEHGICAGRDDLPVRYGLVRDLPPDGGLTCSSFQPPPDPELGDLIHRCEAAGLLGDGGRDALLSMPAESAVWLARSLLTGGGDTCLPEGRTGA
jgi:hypothetical protein